MNYCWREGEKIKYNLKITKRFILSWKYKTILRSNFILILYNQNVLFGIKEKCKFRKFIMLLNFHITSLMALVRGNCMFTFLLDGLNHDILFPFPTSFFWQHNMICPLQKKRRYCLLLLKLFPVQNSWRRRRWIVQNKNKRTIHYWKQSEQYSLSYEQMWFVSRWVFLCLANVFILRKI